MGHLVTVIGYTIGCENHGMSRADFFRLIAKKMWVDGLAINPTDKSVENIIKDVGGHDTPRPKAANLKIELYDDIFDTDPPETDSDTPETIDADTPETVYIDNVDEYTDLLTTLAYRDCPDIRVGTVCCFEGIIVDYDGEYDEPTTSLKYRYKIAKKWIKKLDQQSRIDQKQWHLVSKRNCCS